MRFKFFFLVLCLGGSTIHSQTLSTPQNNQQKAAETRKKLINEDITHLSFRNIGPSIMGGRVVDIDVNPNNPREYYVAFASGGLWKTTNNGASFTPLFDTLAVMTIGDIAVDWRNNETIWVGTGESNSSRSSYAGNGIYLSKNKGKSWEWLGLPETQHIGRIVLDPENAGTAYVAALGHLFTNNKERGIFKTTDFGKTWGHTLFVNDKTGAVDLAIDPFNPNHLISATWERIRTPWNFTGNGIGSGIYESFDAGNTWKKASLESSGFPQGNKIGRIGVTFSTLTPGLIFAVLDNQNSKKEEKSTKSKTILKPAYFLKLNAEAFFNLPDSQLGQYLDAYDFPDNLKVSDIKTKVQQGEIKPAALFDYVSDGNRDLFDTHVIGAEVYRSDNGGKNWNRTHTGYFDQLFFSYGYYFAQISVSPQSDSDIVIMGVPIMKSTDGGKTFKKVSTTNVHSDHHIVWMDPKQEGHWINGNDGGVNETWDAGEHFTKVQLPPVGQFYTVQVDNAKPYNIYGGLQDNGVWVGTAKGENPWWISTGKNAWSSVMGGDGMQVQVDLRDNKTMYTGFQFGNYYRLNRDNSNKQERITPAITLGEKAIRFNWQTPILLSKHNGDILYIGANKLYRSMQKGDDMIAISPDLTLGGKPGNVPFGTITCIAESAKKFGRICIGTDDGQIQLTHDGGETWASIAKGLPTGFWVRKVIFSNFTDSRIFAILNGHTYDNFEALAFVSEDFGKTWQRIGLNLPNEPLNCIIENPSVENMLFVGSDHGLYGSIDNGKTFFGLNGNTLPHVPVHDLAIQSRENDLVVATHGRSIYVASLEWMNKITPSVLEKPITLFEIKDSIRFSSEWGKIEMGDTVKPEISIPLFVKENGDVSILVKDASNKVVFKSTETFSKGINFWRYALKTNAESALAFLTKGSYTVEFSLKNEMLDTFKLTVLPQREIKKRY